jgi:hypothetical protein
MKHFWLALLLMFIFVGCATSEKNSEPIVPIVTPKLDYQAIQESVGIDVPDTGTGFREKTFDACDLGGALFELNPPIRDCHHVYFVWIGFQLSCRESEESASILTEADLKPVSSQMLHWKVGNRAGDSQSDYQGHGVIRMLSNSSAKKAYLRLSNGNDFLNMHAADVSAIVTPPSWCESHGF